MDIENVLKLMAGMKESGIDFLQLEDEQTNLTLKRRKPQLAVQALPNVAPDVVVPQPSPNTPAGAPAQLAEDVVEASKPGQIVTAPVVGIFFAAASPDADPFVEVGSEVKRGDIICIIEAMKLMNEVSSTATGQVLEVFVNNGEKVQYGDPLFRIG